METWRTPADPSYSGLRLGVIVSQQRLERRLHDALGETGIVACARASSAPQLRAAASQLDVVVLYETGEDADLLDEIRVTRGALPEAKLIAIWPRSSASSSRKALRAGADGLVSDAHLGTTLGPTIRVVGSGLVCVPRPMRAPLESESLSMREKQVLGMLVMGFTNAEIAAKLYLAESTVKSHLSSAYTKLGVRSRKDAATMILDPIEGLGPGILAISA